MSNVNRLDAKTALHTAARRFCQDRFSEWAQAYNNLQMKENYRTEILFKPGWGYSEDAYRVFPRYRIDAIIQAEVERLIPDSANDLAELRSRLIDACTLAENRLLEGFTKVIARKAVCEEAADFQAYIQVLEERDLADISPLPYRRVLAEEESNKLWNKLKEAWGIGNGYWFPLREGRIPEDLLTFHVDYFSKMDGADLLREALRNHRVSRIFQLNEFKSTDPEYEIELSLLEPRYASGDEQYCTSETLDWIVYASHESSLTIGGDWLVDIMKERWPDWNQRAYGGPYSTDDRRGTWKTNE
jgi:hypothetical protein